MAKDCLDILSRQEGDVLLARTGFETIPADQSVLPFQVLGMDGNYIISPYNCSLEKALEDSVAADIVDIYKAFSLLVWFTAGVTTIILMALLSICSMVDSQRDRLFSKNNSGCLTSHIGVIRRKLIKGRLINEKLISRKIITEKLIRKKLIQRNFITRSVWIVISFILMNPKDVNSKFYVLRMLQLLIAIFAFMTLIAYFMNAITTDRLKMKEKKYIDHMLTY